MLPIDLEVRGINHACAGSPGYHFLSFSFADLEIVIKKPSRIRWRVFPAFADVLDREIRKFDFLTDPVFCPRPVRGLLFRRGMSANDRTAKSQHTAEQKEQRRIICRVQEVCELFGNDGSDSSIVTQGNLSSSQIAFCGANGAGSSSDAIVTSTVSESLLSSTNKCVPQHGAKERMRFACAILRDSPFVVRRSSRRTDPQVTYGAPALRRQSTQ
jgi:hypothetical protein